MSARSLRVAASALAVLCACGPVEAPADADAPDASAPDVSPAPDAAPEAAAPADASPPRADASVPEIPSTADPLFVRAVAFNSTNVPLGVVQAVTENGTTAAFFGSVGMKLLRAGALLASSAEVTAWRAADTVPAGIGTGQWIVAADTMGRVHRVRPDNQLELVSDRYGLAGQSVRWIEHAGGSYVGFATDAGIAVADGMTVRRFMEGPFTAFAAGSNRFAGAGMDRVRVLDAATGTLRTWNLPGASAVAVDPAGRVLAASGAVLWAEGANGVLAAVYRAPAPIRSMTRSGARVWFAAGTELGVWVMGRPAITGGAMVPMDGRLFAATSDEVWVLTNGAPRRFAVDTGMQTPEAIWRATIQPIYAASCARCHGPGQQSPDLSTYAGWNTNRPSLDARVVQRLGSPMPPDNSITDAQRMTIGRWLMMR
jgi:mono/diheme cytochrome c family protein